jgi:hypothetical protein
MKDETVHSRKDHPAGSSRVVVKTLGINVLCGRESLLMNLDLHEVG